MATSSRLPTTARPIRADRSRTFSEPTTEASGAVEAVFSTLVLQNDIIPPTINYTTPDPICDLDYVPNTPRKAVVDHVMSNSFGFGGHNATLVVSRYK